MKHKYKRHSNESVERIHEYIFNCGGIVSGSVISKTLHMSISSANCNAREAIRRYGDIESVSGVGYRKKGIDYSYSITANLYSEEENNYIYHWDGPQFKRKSSIEKAKDCWSHWWPPEQEAKKQIEDWKKEHPCDNLEIEIGLWDGNGDEIEFYNMSARYYE